MRTELSPQQEKVVELVAAGKTNADIGQILSLSTETVKNYVRTSRRKLFAENRTLLAVKYERLKKDG